MSDTFLIELDSEGNIIKDASKQQNINILSWSAYKIERCEIVNPYDFNVCSIELNRNIFNRIILSTAVPIPDNLKIHFDVLDNYDNIVDAYIYIKRFTWSRGIGLFSWLKYFRK